MVAVPGRVLLIFRSALNEVNLKLVQSHNKLLIFVARMLFRVIVYR